MTYLTLNEAETAALVRAVDDADVVSVQLSRRDSLDQPYDQGFLTVSVVMRDGTQHRDAISEMGATTLWSS
jgi:hypothetical protein